MEQVEERVRAQEEEHQEASADGHATEERQIDEATRMPAPLIFETIRRDGTEEMTRPKTSLVYSGFAAGILMSFSILGEGIIRTYLPDAEWSHLVSSLGYTFGFLLVVMGRMQLFTENTITTVLPLISRPCKEYLFLTTRLWGIVLGSNVLGALVAALFYSYIGGLPTAIFDTMLDISEEVMGHGFFVTFARGMPAGVLVAALVWLMPTVPRNPFPIVIVLTWLIAAGEFMHIIAGSVEMWLLMVNFRMGPGDAIFGFFIPALLGNVVGGSFVFALLAWAQVADEVEQGGAR